MLRLISFSPISRIVEVSLRSEELQPWPKHMMVSNRLTSRSMKTSHAYKITAVAIAPHCPLGVSLSNILTKTQH